MRMALEMQVKMCALFHKKQAGFVAQPDETKRTRSCFVAS